MCYIITCSCHWYLLMVQKSSCHLYWTTKKYVVAGNLIFVDQKSDWRNCFSSLQMICYFDQYNYNTPNVKTTTWGMHAMIIIHNSVVRWVLWRLRSPASRLFVWQHVPTLKGSVTSPLWGKSTECGYYFKNIERDYNSLGYIVAPSYNFSMCQKRVSRAERSNYIPQMWYVITCSCHWYLLLAPKSSCRLYRMTKRYRLFCGREPSVRWPWGLNTEITHHPRKWYTTLITISAIHYICITFYRLSRAVLYSWRWSKVTSYDFPK